MAGKSLAAAIAAMHKSIKAAEKATKEGAKAPASEALLDKDAAPRSKEDCIEILQAMVKARPKQVISRNFFRVHSPMTESVWNRHFGTFHEFKRQAGIVLSRQQHRLEREIAKHASVDHYRKLGAERASWGDKYRRENNRRWQLWVFASDLHDEEVDPFWLRVFLDVLKRANPDRVAFVGDVLDLPEFGKYGVDPREWGPTRRIKFARDRIFKPTREAVGEDCEIELIEGNHEFRALRHLADESPALKVILSELHGMTMQSLFKLDEYQINWVGKADLAAFTERDIQNELRQNYRIYGDGAFLAYHYPDGRSMKMPGVNGHHHRHQVWQEFSPIFGAYEWHQMGAGHRRDASYAVGEKWGLGFDIYHYDTHTRAGVHEYVQITDIASVGGKLYVREPHEAAATPLITPGKAK